MHKIERIASLDRFTAIEKDWSDLHQACCGGIFVHHAFLRSWVETYGRGRRLNVVLLREDGRLVAALPLFATGSERAHAVMGEGRAGLAEWLIHPNVSEPHEALGRMLLPKLFTFLRFEPLEQANADLLERAAAWAGLKVRRKSTMRASSIRLEGSFGSYLKGLKSKTRQKYNRSERLLGDKGVCDLATNEDGPAAMRGFIEASGHSWKALSGTGLGVTEDGRRFLALLNDRLGPKTCRFAARVVNGKAISGSFMLLHGKTLFGMANDFDEAFADWNVGRNSILQSVREAFETDADQCDFTRSSVMLQEVSNEERYLDRVLVHRPADPAIALFFAGQLARRIRRRLTGWKKGRRSVVR